MPSPAPLAPDPFGLAGRATVEAWLSAYDVGRTWNRTATAELLALLDPGSGPVGGPQPLVDTVTETAEVADSLAGAQQTLLYLTGATLFGMAPREEVGEPIRLDLRED